MKKRKIFLIVILCLIAASIIMALNYHQDSNYIEENIPQEETEKEIIAKILAYDLENELINQDFLNWLNKNYGLNVLNSLLEELQNKTYSLDSFYKITGNSFLVLQDYYHNVDNLKVINNQKEEVTLSFVGDVSLADNWDIMPKYQERGKGVYGILSEDVVNIMQDADMLVVNSEFTVSTRGNPLKNKMFTFRAHPDNLKVYEEMGVDLVTLANNHVYDFGKEAFLDMLEAFDNYNIPRIGAGKNLEEAAQAYYVIINGKKYAFVNATRAEKNIMTPGALENSEGVLRCYDPTNFINAIKKAKAQSDYVIALIHWGRENYHTLETEQVDSAKKYIEAGADAIIGTHAHVLQGFEFYQDKFIAYNLGDFIFSAKTKDTGILNLKINKDGIFSYYFIPCLMQNSYTKTLEDEAKLKVLKDLESYSSNASLNELGQIKMK